MIYHGGFKHIIVLALLSLIYPILHVNAQGTSINILKFAPGTQGLSIGDEVPDLSFQMVNHPTKISKLSDFGRKLIILDFWFTGCSACLEYFPKIDSLQKEFNGRLQFLPITKDNEEKVSTLLQRRKNKHGEEYNLPFAVSDTLASFLFKHELMPHYVWISENRTVVAITSSAEVTGENIQGLLEGKQLKLQVKKDLMNFNYDKPLFLNGNGGNGENLKYRSSITGYIEGLPTEYRDNVDSNNLTKHVLIVNAPILNLYLQAYSVGLPSNRILLDVKDPNKLTTKTNWDSWKRSNTYCYELITPPTEKEAAYKHMQHDLTSYFGFQAAQKKQKVKCLILKKDNLGTKALTAGGKPSTNIYDDGKIEAKYMRNMPLSDLIDLLDNNYLPIPLVNETLLDKETRIDIDLPADLSKIGALRIALKNAGFVLMEDERELNMFVISDDSLKNVHVSELKFEK